MSSTSPSERRPVRLTPSPDRGIAHLSGLPAPLTPILGRHQEITAIRALLDSDGTRLLTLTGPGGIGKTRLALELASQVQHDFAHGACFVTLAALRDPELVPSAVARALGVRESNDHSIADVLATALRTRHLLLVIDNMEQVAAAAPWLTDLLTTCPRLKVLVTSRIPLHIQGEQRFPVPPLPVPDADHQQPVEALSQYAAVALFTQRARAVQPTFSLSEANAGVVRHICQRLDGLPLAIELAAARVNILPPASILARLTNRLALLTGARRAVPDRHQTMHNAIAWSHDLLSPEEQALFRRVAVFTGGFTLDEVRHVAFARDRDTGHEDAPQAAPRLHESTASVLDLMASLVDQSLVRQAPLDNGEPRFTMLETIREFGLERLDAHAEAGLIRRRQAGCFLALVEEAAPQLHGADQVSWMNRLQSERDNLRAALEWATGRGEARLGLRIASSLWWFWWVRGDFTEGLATLDALMALPSASARTPERGRALSMVGVFAMMQSPARDIEALHHEALDIAHEVDDHPGTAFTLLSLGFLAVLRRDEVGQAISYLDQSRNAYHELGDDWGQAAAIHFLGRVAFAQGDLALARTHLEAALALSRQAEDLHGIASSFIFLGMVMHLSGDVEQARLAYREAVQRYAYLGDRGNLIPALEGLAGVLEMRGQVELAARLFGAAATVRRSIGMPVSPSERPRYETDRDRVRLALGDVAFASAWTLGEAMTLGEAIAAALADKADSVESPPITGTKPPAAPHGLSPRELEVLKLLADGLTSHEIAGELFISHRTVTTHASNILGKLGLTSRTAAVAHAIRHGLA